MNPIPNGDTYCPPAVAPAPSGAGDEGLVIVKEITERDSEGRPQRMVERHRMAAQEELVIFKQVLERDGDGHAPRVRESDRIWKVCRSRR